MALTAEEIWRDFEVDSVPASGAHKPIKADIRDWGAMVEAGIGLPSVGTAGLFVALDAVNGLVTRPIVGDDLPACQFVELGGVKAYAPVAGTALVGLDEGGAFSTAPIRERLTAARTYNVSKTGNDTTGDGSAGLPFKTIMKAIDVASGSLDLATFGVTISIGAGTYNLAANWANSRAYSIGDHALDTTIAPPGFVCNVAHTSPAAGTTFAQYRAANPTHWSASDAERAVSCSSYIGVGPIALAGAGLASTILSCSWANPVTKDGPGGRYTISGMRITAKPLTSGFNGLTLLRNGQLDFNTIDFGPVGGAHISATSSSIVTCNGNYTISGNAAAHVTAAQNCNVAIAGRTITITGTPAFAQNYVGCTQSAICVMNGCTFTGTATGKSATLATNGTVDCALANNQAAADYLPGNLVGAARFSEATGGILT